MAIWGKKENKDADPETRENRKKAGPIRSLWQKFRGIDWKNPVNKWKLLFVSLVGCIVVFGGGYGVLSFTNSPSFCSNCHEMAPEYSTFTASAHNQISCVQCHIKPGTINMLTHKVKSLKEVYYHVTGVPKQIVQTEEEAVSNGNCQQCHSLNRVVTGPNGLKVDHQKHIKEGIPCITCHSGVVHAQIAARELNVEKNHDAWTKQNADKLIEKKFMQPNMGTCIDCHNKVNNGEKPWEEPSYNVPVNPEEPEKKENEKTSPEETQKVILEALKSNTEANGSKLKIPVGCSTCHSKDISVPKNHLTAEFNKNHGTEAVSQLNQCLSCHEDSKWSREISKQDIKTLLKYSDVTKKYVPNLATAKEEANNNTFCKSCHSTTSSKPGT
ncbi:NapC/NirT family cytochrome c [Bacillus sp. 1P10SD]|uniref:cytochrome c3 family protein n=1 Tax=Bacillus sp. 1P10SD TaxID=3132265 RepID=UPI0039A56505